MVGAETVNTAFYFLNHCNLIEVHIHDDFASFEHIPMGHYTGIGGNSQKENE